MTSKIIVQKDDDELKQNKIKDLDDNAQRPHDNENINFDADIGEKKVSDNKSILKKQTDTPLKPNSIYTVNQKCC